MSCSLQNQKPDWKAYALAELTPAEKGQAEAHAAACPACREELATVRLTLDSMSALRQEEIPRRIAFVSDKVFEPKWWQMFLNPTFAAACVVALAILVHAYVRPGGNDVSEQARIDASVKQAVSRALDQVEARNAEAFDIVQKQYQQIYKQTSGFTLQ